MSSKVSADLILHNGHITTLDPQYPEAANLAVKDGYIVGVDEAEEYERGPNTTVIDLNGRRVIPGLNDSHLHVIRGGLNYNLELRWDGVPSLADALRMLKEQTERTPSGQWVRVVGGWTEFQFAERRMPTLDEVNAAAPDTPVFILHLYCRALLNQAALRACASAVAATFVQFVSSLLLVVGLFTRLNAACSRACPAWRFSRTFSPFVIRNSQFFTRWSSGRSRSWAVGDSHWMPGWNTGAVSDNRRIGHPYFQLRRAPRK